MKARGVRIGITTAIAVSCLAAGSALTLASAPAASAAPVAVHHGSLSRAHVSPFGVRAARSARPVSRRRAPARHGTTVTTEWVSNQVPPGSNTGCASPGYSTITDAINAASTGDIIKVCAGTYDEQLVITTGVTLESSGAVTVVAPSAPASPTSCDGDGGSQPNQDIVDICGAINVTITGFTFQGSWDPGVCYDSIYGVAVLGGASLTMSKSTVEDVGGNPQTDGCQGGVGIEVGLALTGTTSDPGTAKLTNDTVLNYQKNGITVDGGGSSASISGTTVTGTGPTTAIAQNGIQVSDGATAKITGGAVSGDECNDSAGGCGSNGFTQVQSAGVLLFDAGKTTVTGTTVSASDIGVYSVQDYAWTYYTPPSPFSAVLDTFTGLGLNNRYENAYLDEGKATLTSSTLSGGEVGVEVPQGSYQTTPDVATVTGDTIAGTASVGDPSAAILLASDSTAGDKKPKVTATSDSFDTSNAGGGIVNQSTSVITATGDWWGDATGPSDWSFGLGSSVSQDVDFYPWALDSAFGTFETCTSGTSVTASSNDEVLCAPTGTANAFLANNGFDVLILGNGGNDQLVGSSTGESWIIGGLGGSNIINGKGGVGFIQKRGNRNDSTINASKYTVAGK
jgi:hypothetical protein